MNQSMISGARWTYAFLLMTSLFWGSAFVGSKLTVTDVPPSVSAFIRFGMGAVLMLGFLLMKRKPGDLFGGLPWRRLLLLGIVGVGIYNLFFFWGLKLSEASHGSMIVPTLSPVFTFLLGALWLKNRPTRRQLLGLGVAVSGSALFFSAVLADGSAELGMLAGDLCFLFAALCFAFYTLYGNRVMEALNPFAATALTLLIGTVFLGAAAVPDVPAVNWSRIGAGYWLLQGYLALFPTVLAFWFYYRGVQALGSARTVVFLYIVPVVGTLLAALVLHETLLPRQLAGGAVMLAGVWLVNRKREPATGNAASDVS